MPLPAGTRHKRLEDPSRHKTIRVPILTSNPAGEIVQGFFRIPTRMATAKPHSNEMHQFEGLLREKVREWGEWWSRKDWEIDLSTLTFDGPYIPPTEKAGDETEEDFRLYYVEARFKQLVPLYLGIDEAREGREDAERYGVDLRDEKLPDSARMPLRNKDDSDGFGDPLEQAEERRRTKFLKRELEVKDGQLIGATIQSTF